MCLFCLHAVSTLINLICLCSKQAWTPPAVPGWWNRLRACPRGALPNKATPLRWPGWEARKTTITVGKHAACVYKCHTDLKLTHLRFSQIICWYKRPSPTNVCVHTQKTTKEAYMLERLHSYGHTWYSCVMPQPVRNLRGFDKRFHACARKKENDGCFIMVKGVLTDEVLHLEIRLFLMTVKHIPSPCRLSFTTTAEQMFCVWVELNITYSLTSSTCPWVQIV